MGLFCRSCVSDRVLGHLVRGFHFGGNEKVMRFMKTNTFPESWPSLTDWPGYIGQIRSYPEGYNGPFNIPIGYNGQTRSHPEGMEIFPLVVPRKITKSHKNAIFEGFTVFKRRVPRFDLSFGLYWGYKVFTRVRGSGEPRPTVPDTWKSPKITKKRRFRVFFLTRASRNDREWLLPKFVTE